MPSTRLPGTSMPRRLAWADIAKGGCIVLVVVHHLTSKHLDLMAGDQATVAVSMWLALSDALKALRMPLFFVLSGMFAASALRRPWRAVLRSRIASPAYVYAVWLVIHAAIFSVATTLPMNRTQNLGELLADLAFASTGLWYLYALPVYFALARLATALDVRLVLAMAAALSAVCSWLPIDEVNRVSVLQHFVFFAAGVYLPQVWRRIGELDRPRLVPALVAAYAGLGAVLAWLDVPRSVVTLLLSAVAVPLGIRLAVSAASSPRLAAVAGSLGRRTLPVYVLHVPAISLLHALVTAAGVDLPGAALVVYPLLATAAVTAACLAAHRLLMRAGLDFLFRLPSPSGARPRRLPPPDSRRLRGPRLDADRLALQQR